MKMKTNKKYTKQQILESIKYWKKQLNESITPEIDDAIGGVVDARDELLEYIKPYSIDNKKLEQLCFNLYQSINYLEEISYDK